MGKEKNEELLRYFHDRRVWAVNVSDRVPQLTPYKEDWFSKWNATTTLIRRESAWQLGEVVVPADGVFNH